MKLTDAEQALLDSLLEYNYVQVEAYGRLRAGTRVLIGSGPGTVVAVTEKPDSAWSKSWHMDDVELIVRPDDRDVPHYGPAQVAQYHIRQILEEATP